MTRNLIGSVEAFFHQTNEKDVKKLAACIDLKNEAEDLITVVQVNTFQSPPQYVKLVGNLEGTYYRRICIQHRSVYQVLEKEKATKVLRLSIPNES